MTRPRFCRPIDGWPDVDRQRWRAACTSPEFLERDRPASHWSPDRRTIAERAYGYWLCFLKRQGGLDPSSMPGDRATDDRLQAFVAELQERVAPVSAAMIVGALLRMLTVLEPQRDWALLARVHRHLKRTAVPSRNKLARIVPAPQLFELGILLMETWDTRPQRAYQAARYRVGLMIALLIACPIRLKNLAQLMIGRHLVFDGRDYRLHLTAAETKTRRPYVAAVPPELTPYIDRWLRVHRPALESTESDEHHLGSPLAAGGIGSHLWLDIHGRPLETKAIQRQIAFYTKRAFGRAIRPHLFRDCAVTEFVDVCPEDIALAPDLLGQAQLRTTRKHYVHAQGMIAHTRVQDLIAARRRTATSPSDTRRRSGA
jgi:integrase/recombinase XerD